MKKKKKIGILHPKLEKGGSELAAIAAIDALKDDYEVSLITSGKVDIKQLNAYYGVNLNPEKFLINKAPLPFFLQNTSKFAALRGRLIKRYCQKIAPNFDLLISTYNFSNFGKKAIHLIADFSFDENLRREIDLTPEKWKKVYHRDNFLRKLYLGACKLIPVYYNSRDWREDIVIANSHWTAELLEKKYNIKPLVVYPPVMEDFLDSPFEKREQGFVFIGRIVPEKRVDMVIEILKKVREKGFDIHLHIVGGLPNDQYGKSLRKIFEANRDWIFYEGWLGKEKKKEIIVKHRFGISGRKNEPFGIAVAEMVKGGCIVFVPNGGGQTEIVNNSQLVYDNIKEAVEKMTAVLRSEEKQKDLLKHLLSNSQKFSIGNFQKEIKNIVADFFNETKA